jgi:ribonuclease Y
LIAAADAISASRRGARSESLDAYIKRLEELETIARGFNGVSSAYAIQAGREIRVMVSPEEVDDIMAPKLCRDIVKKIESDMEYPGQVKVVLIRETRNVEVAH